MIRKIYFDACIFIAYFHEKHTNHLEVKECLEAIKNIDLECYSSFWSINEMVKVLVRECKYRKQDAEKYAKKIYEENSLGSIKINWVGVGDSEKYSFQDFFDHITLMLINSKEDLHLADAIHSIIMINNEIDTILTTNGNHFRGLKDFIPIEPKMICAILGKKKK